MKASEISSFILALHRWYQNDLMLSEVEIIGGLLTGSLRLFLLRNAMLDYRDKPDGSFAFQHIVDCVILWLSLRRIDVKG